MQFIKLSRKDFEKAAPAKKENPAMPFLKSLKIGEGGYITTEMANVGRQTVKAKVKARMREMTKRRMLAAVPQADLVVMNPTHYAVALKYDAGKPGAAPKVLA